MSAMSSFTSRVAAACGIAVVTLILIAQVQAAPQISVTPKITYEKGVLATVHLKLSDEGKYKVRLKVKWPKNSTRDVSFTFRTDGDFFRQCPNSTCVPLVWAFSYDSYLTAQAPEFDFMTAGVTAQIMIWKAGGPLVFKRTYAFYWIGRPGDTQIIRQGTDAFVNYCINEGKEIRSSGGRLYCVKVRLGTFKVKRVPSR